MKFFIFSKSPAHTLPPVISLSYAAKSLGYKVFVVSQNVDKSLRESMGNNDIRVVSFDNKEYSSKLLKLIHWFRFNKFALRKYLETGNQDIVWISGADTAICMGVKNLKKRKFYFQVNELYDQFPHYLKKISRISKAAHKVVVPERNRAAIFQVWFNLAKRPFILPNQPYIDDKIIAKNEHLYQSHIDYLQNAKSNGLKILLYQGYVIGNDRDLTPLLKSIRVRKDILVVLMGADYHNSVSDYREIFPNIYHIPSIPAPFHLSITRHADIGILSYSPVSLNNLYCAPNKIWEYTRYGLAIIGNDIIGLDCIEASSIGVKCDFSDSADISSKIDDLIRNLENHKKSSLEFYDSHVFMDRVSSLLTS